MGSKFIPHTSCSMEVQNYEVASKRYSTNTGRFKDNQCENRWVDRVG